MATDRSSFAGWCPSVESDRACTCFALPFEALECIFDQPLEAPGITMTTEYERQREEKIAENKRRLQELGLQGAAESLAAEAGPPAKKKQRCAYGDAGATMNRYHMC